MFAAWCNAKIISTFREVLKSITYYQFPGPCAEGRGLTLTGTGNFGGMIKLYMCVGVYNCDDGYVPVFIFKNSLHCTFIQAEVLYVNYIKNILA